MTRSRRRPTVLLAALVALLVVAAMPASAGAQQCAGVMVSSRMEVSSLPGGSWTARDVCVAPEHVYEVDVLGYHLVAGMGVAAFDEGHLGRLAFAELTVGPGESWTLVGMEDHGVDHVTWTLAEGRNEVEGGIRRSGGEGISITPTAEVETEEPGWVTLEHTGDPTDLRTAEGPIPDELRRLLDEAVGHLTR